MYFLFKIKAWRCQNSCLIFDFVKSLANYCRYHNIWSYLNWPKPTFSCLDVVLSKSSCCFNDYMQSRKHLENSSLLMHLKKLRLLRSEPQQTTAKNHNYWSSSSLSSCIRSSSWVTMLPCAVSSSVALWLTLCAAAPAWCLLTPPPSWSRGGYGWLTGWSSGCILEKKEHRWRATIFRQRNHFIFLLDIHRLLV